MSYDPNQYDFYSPEEIEQLATGAASGQDRAIFLTAAFTGLRMGELIVLRWATSTFDTKALHVYGPYSLGTLTAPSPDSPVPSRPPSKSTACPRR